MRIYKRRGKYYIDYFYKGKRVRKAVSRNRRMAETVARDVELKMERGELLGIADLKRISFIDFSRLYLRFSEANKSATSHRRDVTSLRALASFCGGYLHQITPESVEEYKATRRTRVSPASVNRELSCLGHLLRKAVEWGYLGQNPMHGVKQLKEPPGRLRYLEPEEVLALLNASSERIRPIVLIAVQTGMRRGEIMRLKWSDIDFRNRSITIERTKNNERRIVPLSEILLADLLKLSQKREFVFPFAFPQRHWKKAVREAGLKDFRFHDLRHTFASHLAMNGCSMKTIQTLLGHKDIKMAMRYSHLSQNHLDDVVNRVSRTLLGLGEPSQPRRRKTT